MSGLSPVQADKQLYNFSILPLPVQTLIRVKYFVLKFAISSKGGIYPKVLKYWDT